MRTPSLGRLVVGTRGSPLALIQTEEVLRVLRADHPNVEFVVKEVRTQGDIAGEAPLKSMPRGLFAKELENALARGDIHMAVHSFKDLPTEVDARFAIAAIGKRQDPRDVLVTSDRRTLAALPDGARLGTSSPRRFAQLKAHRPALELLPIRGNVGTRIRKAHGPDFDGVVLAAAGIHRLGLHAEIAEYIAPEVCLPAVGQGALAIEVRSGDRAVARIAAAADHRASHVAVTAEQAVLQRLGGGCRTPIAAYAELVGGTLRLRGMVASSTGDRLIRAEAEGSARHPARLGARLAESLLKLGATEILAAEESAA